MTDEEVRAGLRRLRVGKPFERVLSLLPAAVVAFFFAAHPERDRFHEILLGILVVSVPVGFLLRARRMRKDAAAGEGKARALYRAHLEKGIRWESVDYILVIPLAILTVLLAAVLLPLPFFVGRRDGSTWTGVMIVLMGCGMALRTLYEHRKTLPWMREQLKSLTAPEASASSTA